MGSARTLRLRRRRDFALLYRRGKVFSNALLTLRALPNGLPHNRYAFVVSKRLGKAVARNLLRRRLREGLRAMRLRPGWDLAIIARVQARGADYHRLREALVDLLSKARLRMPEGSHREGPQAWAGRVSE